MLEKIISTIISVIITALITGIIGYLTGKMKGYKQRDSRQEEALKCLLRSNITSKYYVYSELKEITKKKILTECLNNIRIWVAIVM